MSRTDATVILDLSDKCLLDVFEHMSLLDLCAIAEVCSRFKQIAKMCFGYSNKKDLIFRDDIKSDGDSVDQILFKTSKILRHFGPYFSKFDGYDWPKYIPTPLNEESHAEYRRKIFELVIQYCSGTLAEMTFYDINVNDGMVPLMKPLLKDLRILNMFDFSTGQAFLDMLPLWSTNLRELRLFLKSEGNGNPDRQVLRYDGFHQPFQKMKEISLNHAMDLNNHDIEEMLKHNPQLKRISLRFCRNLDHEIHKFIANYVPGVEDLNLAVISFEQRDVQHFGQFRNLKSLILSTFMQQNYVTLLILQIIEANIPLRSLELSNIYSVGWSNIKTEKFGCIAINIS